MKKKRYFVLKFCAQFKDDLACMLSISVAIFAVPTQLQGLSSEIGVKWSNRNYLKLLTGFECKEKNRINRKNVPKKSFFI